MRTLKQLLWLVYDELQKGLTVFQYGLCNFVDNLKMDGKITHDERMILRKYIREHKPITWYSIISFNTNAVWWPAGWKSPRIRWVYLKVRKMK